MCCQRYFDKRLLKLGIEADISLEYERVDSPFGVRYFIWIPTKDRTPPPQRQLFVGARMLKELVDNRIKTYVHCKHGHGRAPTLVAAYFVLQGTPLREAIKRIRERRPAIHLERMQIRALKKFEIAVRKGLG